MSEMVCSAGVATASCRRCPHCGAGDFKHYDTTDDQFDVCQSCGRSSGLVRKPVLHERPAPRTWRGLTPEQLRILALVLAEDATELRPRRSGFDVMEGLVIVSKRLEREAKRRERKGSKS